MNGQLIIRDPTDSLRVLVRECAERQRQLHPHEVAYILKVAAREILPAAGLDGRCQQLRLFADWTLHEEIDRSATGQAAIATIAEAVSRHGESGCDNKWVEEQFNNAVSFGTLRLELLAVCQRFEISDELFSSWEIWQRFALPLALELSGRWIRLGDGPHARAAKRRIESTSLPEPHRPQRLTLGFDPQGKARWCVQTAGNVFILVQVLFGGLRSEDVPAPEGWQSPLAP